MVCFALSVCMPKHLHLRLNVTTNNVDYNGSNVQFKVNSRFLKARSLKNNDEKWSRGL